MEKIDYSVILTWVAHHREDWFSPTCFTVFHIVPVFCDSRPGYVRSCHVITDSQSVCLSWPRSPDCDSRPYFSLEENFGVVFHGVSTPHGAAMCRGHSRDPSVQWLQSVWEL